MKINLGCGKHTLEGWFCIDVQQHPDATRPLDMVSDVKKIALPDECADEIMAIHLFEHLYRWECDEVIEEWKRLLKPGGKLILEMPDLLKFCSNIIKDVKSKHEGQMGMWGAYGDPREKNPYMCHRWGWTYRTIKPFLESHGFKNLREEVTQWHPSGRMVRDFRVVAYK